MHALRSSRHVLAGLGLAAFMIGFTPRPATALPHFPVTRNTYRLFARAISFINVNRVYMGVNNIGEVGVDSAGRGTVQGGYWPRGTPDNYIFNAGLQVAGVVGGVKSPANPWGGDTAGGWFFDGAGGRQETEGVTPAYQAFNSADAANWPAQAFVPQGDAVANVYATPLQGLVSASQGDVQFLAWEGNPAFNAARIHPLGILADYRLLAWNYPAGAQDIVFLVATIYNVTSANCADYAAHRAGIRPILCAQGQKFQVLNNAKFGITLPAGGYTITKAFVAAAEDDDVGSVNANFNGLILPFAMGYTYDGPFSNNITGWKFDPTIFAAPFFAGSGFVGTKYLKGPDGPGAIQLMQTFCNGGPCGDGHSDPGSMIINYRILAGTPAATDGQCNITAPGKTAADLHVCFMLTGATGADTRRLESSTQLTLAPGQGKTLVVAYIYAAPVAIPGFTPSSIQHDPGNVTWSNSTDSMFKYNASGSPGLNLVDSISGFLRYKGPHFNGDGSVHQPLQSEFDVVKGSLLGKALVAQAVFDAKFLQEFAPDAPQFFLIPGDKQVTILWKPSATETTGDPYFQVVKSPTAVVNGLTTTNPLYDPNYRQFDVEGYRIYRGRSDSPSALRLLAQYDYGGTKIKDYTGFVVNGNCAPELGILTDCPETTPAGGFPTLANPTPPLTAATRSVSYNIGPQPDASPLQFVDQTTGTRLALAGGTTTIATVVDTVVSGGGSGFPALDDGGVPFVFVDRAGDPGCENAQKKITNGAGCGVHNGVNYFYSVVAFDVNAPGHGPTSLESAKVTKQVIPQALAGNFSSSGAVAITGPSGRNGPLTDAVVPTIDSVTGKFSKKQPPTNAATVAVGALVSQVLKTVNASVRLDSISVGSTGTFGNGANTNATEYLSVTNAAGTTAFTVPVTIGFGTYGTGTTTVNFGALAVDSALSAAYGGGAGYVIPGSITLQTPGDYYTVMRGRGCVNGDATTGFGTGRQCYFNGPRWFVGDNETMANPNSDNAGNFSTGLAPVAFSNSGELAGVTRIFLPSEYNSVQSSYRDVEIAFAPFVSAADYRLYWGAAGKVDSVIDLTHQTVVPFDTRIRASWGILNGSAVPAAGSFDGRAELTFTDISCVAPLSALPGVQGRLPCNQPTPAVLSQTAIPGPVVFCGALLSCNTSAPAAAGSGFLLYLKGRPFLIQLASGLPTAGTQWTMRDYTGAIRGGNGVAGNFGPYIYTPDAFRPFTAPGVSYQMKVTTSNTVSLATGDNLAKVHTVPDPYYVTSAYDIAVNSKDIQFVNVPTGATIRIYTSSGILIRVLQNTTTTFGGIVHWNVRNRTNQFVSSGVYFYNVEAGGISHTGRMTIVNYASTVQ